jgi:hypothetical protein
MLAAPTQRRCGSEKGIRAGDLDEAPGSAGASIEVSSGAAAEAVRCASELLADDDRVPPDVAMRFLPWLVAAAPQDALSVLQVTATALVSGLPCAVVTQGLFGEAAGYMAWCLA